MLQNLLAERFHLSVHHEARLLPSSALVVGKGGPKLKPSPRDSVSPDPSADATRPIKNPLTDLPWTISIVGDRFRLSAKRMDLSSLAVFIESTLDTPVADETGLAGYYEFTLDYSPLGYSPAGPPDLAGADPGTDLPSALQSQLGLKLNTQKLSRDVIVVDHVDEAPTDN